MSHCGPGAGRRNGWSGLRFLLAGVLLLAGVAPTAAREPVIYCTDLFHPHDDPDDHFDLAVMYALPGIELKGIVLDQGAAQRPRPGTVPVSQLNSLTRRRIPAAIGLATPLKSPQDTGVGQAEESQAGVRMILEELERARRPVALVTVGSVRDVTAAFNRRPDLMRRRVSRVLCFIGEATRPDFREWNVQLDPAAFVGLLRSGLRVDWVPCFDGGLWANDGRASFWKAYQGDLLRRAPAELQQYFLYALGKKTGDPIDFLRQPVNAEERERWFAESRNLWCAAVFQTLANRVVTFDPVKGPGTSRWNASGTGQPPRGALFDFERMRISVGEDAVVRPGEGAGSVTVRRFRVLDRSHYAQGMTVATAQLLESFPVAR